MNELFYEWHADLMKALLYALRDGVRIGRIDHRSVEPIMKLAAASNSGAVRKMLELAHSKLHPDPVCDAIASGRPPTMEEISDLMDGARKCMPTQSR